VTVSGFLIAYGGAVILPLAVIEGPLVTVMTGVLSSEGYFSWYGVLCLLIAGDLVGDLLYYAIGRGGGVPLGWIGRRLLSGRGAVTPALQARMRHNAPKMLLLGKWTQSLGCVVLIAAGMLRLPLPGFLLWNLIATIPKSGALFAFGYFADDAFPVFERHWMITCLVLAAVGMASMAFILRRANPPPAGRARS
jgi:membrane protein DedA with SNARE-associated domain